MRQRSGRQIGVLQATCVVALLLIVSCTHTADPPLAPDSSGGNVFVAYDEPPIPIGGFAAIQNDLIYPEAARNAGIEGRVAVQVLVDSTGEAIDLKVLQRLGYGCDQEALRVLLTQQWLPAMQRDKPVKVWVVASVDFALTDD